MAAGAALEARIGDPERAVAADVERMSAIAVGMLAEPAEGRIVDRDRAVRVVGGEDAALAVDEHHLRDLEIALLDADAGAVAVLDPHMGEDQPLDARRVAAQHQRRFALAHLAVEDRRAGCLGDEGDAAGLLHRALAVAAGSDADRALAVADRGDRVGEAGIALAGFGDGEGAALVLRGERGGGDKQRQGETMRVIGRRYRIAVDGPLSQVWHEEARMRILHILDHSLPLHSGYAFRTRAIVKAQLAQGWEVACLTGPRHAADGPDPEVVDGITFYRTEKPEPAPAPLGEYREIRALSERLDRLVEEWKPDQLHAHSPVLTALGGAAGGEAARIASGLRNSRLLGGCGGRERHGPRRLGPLSADSAAGDLCGAPGRRGGGDLRRTRGRSDPARHRGREDHRLAQRRRYGPVRQSAAGRRRRFARSLGLEDAETVGFIGSFYDYEGLDDLIAAMPLLLEKRPKAQLLLVGGGPMEEALKAQAAASPAAERIRFVGRVPHEDTDNT